MDEFKDLVMIYIRERHSCSGCA